MLLLIAIGAYLTHTLTGRSMTPCGFGQTQRDDATADAAPEPWIEVMGD